MTYSEALSHIYATHSNKDAFEIVAAIRAEARMDQANMQAQTVILNREDHKLPERFKEVYRGGHHIVYCDGVEHRTVTADQGWKMPYVCDCANYKRKEDGND